MTTKIPAELSSTPGIVDNSNATAITITSDEKIGIGTASPAAQVELNGDGELLRLDGTGGAARSIRFRGLSTSTPAFITVDGSFKLHCEDSGTHMEFHTADSERMRIDAAGRLMIGTTTEGQADADDLTVANASGNVGISLRTTTTGYASIYFSDATSGGAEASGAVQYKHDDNYMRFTTAESERLRIDSSGNFMLNKTNTNFDTTGFHVFGGSANGRTFITVSNDEVLSLNRKGNAGIILRFFDDESLVGSISTNANSLPSDRNFKKNINDLDLGLNLVTKLKPSQFHYKHDEDDLPVMYGLVAQDLEESLTEVGIEKNSTWLLQHEPNDDEKQSDYSVDYLKLTPILIKAMQEQQEIIEDLKSRIETLEG